MNITSVGVIGGGVMGRSIAVDLLFHGFQVVLVDLSGEILDAAFQEIMRNIRFSALVKKSLPLINPEEAAQNIQLTTVLSEVGQCDFIIENVTEDWAVKEGIYRKLDEICRPEVCFGVNTSCISITKVGSVTGRSGQVIGMHFMNPAVLKPSIEVIKGYYTSEATIQLVNQFLALMEKEAIIVEDLPGFVSNRVSHLFMNEAAFVVMDQVASPEAVDRIFKQCYGHKMGPLETADLIGIDTVVKSLDVLYESYQDSKFRCCPMLRKMVDAGRLGKKSGQGFYVYG
ncbi:3-hydroxyacyl-CoA dehydrogenase family protein [Paenibacillus tritici]|jgi:3-hydroxybutyryl-CoA dehydrogenase|uniref:3-hydroxyacyl-CoA dehydrogenase family protein n=1 Tax=Paenibacillus tritici TaxID=1873425 RepID=A0ABX2DTQ0_9BACL|nr:3-hydroxyacyl-CoA dehydrogenase family protein [Paenibacillus tritici]NQX47755.1 3-hydroxyacyl-CoA dehydrogenase family protein [Paenibacillus tritici]QUL52228.1 3-hydroxyacyl-CoA dehydrogenase family protein [Paenibacillus tritici]